RVFRFDLRFAALGDGVVNVLYRADQPAPQETDQQHEGDAEHQLPRGAETERALEEIAQRKPDRGTEQWTEQGAGAPDGGLNDQLSGGVEREGFRRHERLQDAKQASGESRIGGGDDEGRELVAMHVVANGGRAQRVVAYCAENRADGRTHDTQRNDDAD